MIRTHLNWLQPEHRLPSAQQNFTPGPRLSFHRLGRGAYHRGPMASTSRLAACTLAALLGFAAVSDTTHAQAPISIEVTSPAAGEVLDAGVAYTIRWTSNRDVYEWFLWASPDGGASWDRIWECMYLTPGERSCTWHSPWHVSTRVMVRVTADDDGEAFGSDDSALFTVADRGTLGLPPWWTNGDIGNVGAAGDAGVTGGRFIVHGSGADVWGTADELHFFSRPRPDDDNDMVITARLTSVENVNRWTKAGLMMRNGTHAGAPHVSLFGTPTTSKGIAFQRRTTAGGTSASTAGPAIAPPYWLKLTRREERFVAHYRKLATDAWTRIGEATASFASQQWMQYGLAVSSHVDGRLAKATFDNVTVGGRPSFLATTDVGAVAIAGSKADDFVNLTIRGSGADIWGTADQFRFTYTELWDRDSITVRVRSLTNTHAWAKAGIMVRESTDPGSPHVMVIVSPGKGVAMQYRRTQDGASGSTAARAASAPVWLRLAWDQTGTTYIGYMSKDYVTWTEIGRVTLDFMADNAKGGLAVTSHYPSRLTTAIFDDLYFAPRY